MTDDPMSSRRRTFVQRTAAATMAAIQPAAWAGGSDAPEKREVRIGFMPLTDCASVVMASTLKFDEKNGIRIVLVRKTSWAAMRDGLVSGELDAAHVLYGLAYGLHLGIGGPRQDMAVLMTLNHNGQGISLSRALAEQGAVDGESLARHMREQPRDYTFAQTFPTGTHAMWLYYWLAAHGIDPLADVRVITVPPPQMVANARAGRMDGFCVGEPWNQRGIAEGVSIHAASSQDIWADHPDKVLGTSAAFVRDNPHTARALVRAVLEASRWIDASETNRCAMAAAISTQPFVDVPVDAIEDRILGRYDNGLGRTWRDPHPMRFFGDGAVNFPYPSDGMWFLTQFRRWGLLPEHPDYAAVAAQVNQVALYREAAASLGVPAPAEPLRSARLIDGKTWTGRDPRAFAQSFAIAAA
jgi:nitrate/nitrite transport system substrate-binding protein